MGRLGRICRVTKGLSILKLPAQGAGLPEVEVSFILCSFLPASRLGPRLQGGACGARSGQPFYLTNSPCFNIKKGNFVKRGEMG
jgi:hypothetical protein